MRRLQLILLAAGLIAQWLVASDGLAESPQFDEQVVYRLSRFNGRGYSDDFIPRGEKTIYLLADANHVISPRYTLVYFWPITGKFVAAFKKLNEDVRGSVEILQGDKVVESLEKEEYTIFYPEGIMGDVSQLHVGKDAYAIFEKYEKPLTQFHNRLSEYSKQMLAYRIKLKAYVEDLQKRKDAGLEFTQEQIESEMPKEPPQPERPPFDVTGLKADFIVNLPRGEYQIRTRAEDGTIVEGSLKNVVVFSRRRADRIGYEVIPGDRWTKKENSNDPASSIYATGQNILYLQPFLQDEYRELFYNKLKDPQDTGNPEKWIWVHTEAVKNADLFYQGRGNDPERVENSPYLVKQISGAELGYEILPYNEQTDREKKPAFEGYKIGFSDADGYGSRVLWLENANGLRLEGSRRKIILVDKDPVYFLYLFSLMPIVVGIGVFIYRRKSTS